MFLTNLHQIFKTVSLVQLWYSYLIPFCFQSQVPVIQSSLSTKQPRYSSWYGNQVTSWMIRNSGWNTGRAKRFFFHIQIVYTSSGIHPAFPFNGHQASQWYEADHITSSSAKNVWIYTTMLQNAYMSFSLIKLSFKLLQNEKKFCNIIYTFSVLWRYKLSSSFN